MKKLLLGLVFIGVSIAYASTYHGIVQEIRIAASSSGGTRVSVLTSGTTDCHDGDSHWYSFEYSRTGPGSAWLAALLSAKVSGETVVIHGASACDGSGMERVIAIDLPSPSMLLSQEPPGVVIRPVPGPFHSCPETSISAKLENLDSPTRVPGQYIVMFKLPAALACISASRLSSLRILPGVTPDSPKASRQLADALAESIRATVTSVWDMQPPMFAIRGATDGGVEMLARDPRIASIEANLVAKEQ